MLCGLSVQPLSGEHATCPDAALDAFLEGWSGAELAVQRTSLLRSCQLLAEVSGGPMPPDQSTVTPCPQSTPPRYWWSLIRARENLGKYWLNWWNTR